MTVAELTPEPGESAAPHRILLHGRVIHGLQFLDAERRRQPFSYYAPHGGLGLAMSALQSRASSMHVGVLGLGTGSVAAFGRAGDAVRFYEIDPDVERAAREHFTYLADSPARVSVVLGDGRLSLEREAAQGFDVLVLDAFSGDSLPVHLLTREAFETYNRHLKPDGLLAVNITNKYLDLRPVVAGLAGHFGYGMLLVEHETTPACPQGEYASSWALLTRDRGLLATEALRAAAVPAGLREDVPLWTDDRTNLFKLLRREPRVDAEGRR
jgi:SAM-dependent methyltransferase